MQTVDANAVSLRPLSAAQSLPMLVEMPLGTTLEQALSLAREIAGRNLSQYGGLMFRGLPLDGADAFRGFAAGFGHPLLTYEFGSTPRSKVTQGVYTSTEYPSHQQIPLHNEQAYTRDWPMKIWFYCMRPAQEGGETPIADSRAIYRDMPASIREDFTKRGLMYVRNFGNGLDVPWQQVFGTDSRAVVEDYCRRHAIDCEWKEDGELRTRQICQGVARHPVTQDMVWFNQAHLFHVSNLEPETRETLLEIVDEEDLPRNVLYGDGKAIEDETLAVVRAVLNEHLISFPWQAGDVMMLDNMLTAHARAPFNGPRKVIVAMAEAHGQH